VVTVILSEVVTRETRGNGVEGPLGAISAGAVTRNFYCESMFPDLHRENAYSLHDYLAARDSHSAQG